MSKPIVFYPVPGVKLLKNVMIPMRDGVPLPKIKRIVGHHLVFEESESGRCHLGQARLMKRRCELGRHCAQATL
jgi:hypothetical protein